VVGRRSKEGSDLDSLRFAQGESCVVSEGYSVKESKSGELVGLTWWDEGRLAGDDDSGEEVNNWRM
jgi:hypothetical protein